MTGERSTNPHTRKLPANVTPFIGRQADLDTMLNMLQDPAVRLVTILGVGGIGKTHFALQLAGMLQDHFQHGAVFLPLSQLTSVEELLPAMEVALGVQLPPGSDLQQAVMDHQAVRRIRAGNRPQMHVCILLADHFGVNPNEMLQLARWPTLKAFDIHIESAENLPPEAVEVAKEIARIPNPGTRKTVADAILTLVKKYFEE